ncbi:MAG: hypothetical protein HC904_10980 [Blastochloris sp.]|nr:hypothetical protein [Blastochloris sp.]
MKAIPSPSSPSWVEPLRQLLPGLISTRPADLKEHGGDAWMAHALPDVVVTPRKTSQIQTLLRFCHDHQIPVTARAPVVATWAVVFLSGPESASPSAA